MVRDIGKDEPNEIKKKYIILLIGGTGGGKTSFLNYLANAEKAMKDLSGSKSCEEINDQALENDISKSMVSKTNGVT